MARRVGQIALCAGALTTGAGLAAVVPPPPMMTPAVVPAASTAEEPEARPQPSTADGWTPRPRTAPTTLTSRIARTEEPSDLEERIARIPTVPLRPFAERLARGRVITGATRQRQLLFSFDDGPHPVHTPRLLRILDRLGIKAVFFITASRLEGDGRWARRNRQIAREIVRRGHIIGNHTMDHPQLPLLSDDEVLAQVRDANDVIERVLGERAWLVRPPGGARSDRVDALVARTGSTVAVWNLGAGDFQVRTASDVLRTWRRVLGRRERDHGERGGIILLHDTHPWSVEAVPLIVDWVRERNCSLLAEGGELYEIVGDPTLFFSPRGDARPWEEVPLLSMEASALEARQAPLRENTRRRCTAVASR